MYDKGNKKTNAVYAHYLMTGRVWTMWEGYCHHTTDGSPPETPITEEQVMALSARQPPGPKTLVPWSDEYKDKMLKERSEAAHIRFVDMGTEAFYAVPEAAKDVTRKINAKTAKTRKPGRFNSLKTSKPDMAENERRWRATEMIKRVTGDRSDR